MQQIHEASYYRRRAEELGHPHLWQSYEAILEFLAHFRSALSSYAKCFVGTGPGRNRLKSSSVFGANADLLKKHQGIITLRHKYVAHGDENEFESVRVSEEEGAGELVLHLQYNLSFPFDKLYELREIIRFVEAYVVGRQQAHVAAIAREIGKPVRVLEGRGGNA